MVNKGTALGLWKSYMGTELRRGGTKLNAGREKAESVRSHGAAAGNRHKLILLVGHDLMVINRDELS